MTFIVLLQYQTLYVLVKGCKNKPTTNLQTFIKCFMETYIHHTQTRICTSILPYIIHTKRTPHTPLYTTRIPYHMPSPPHITHSQHPLCTHAMPTSYPTPLHTHIPPHMTCTSRTPHAPLPSQHHTHRAQGDPEFTVLPQPPQQ